MENHRSMTGGTNLPLQILLIFNVHKLEYPLKGYKPEKSDLSIFVLNVVAISDNIIHY